jgi:hypothetical protein
VVGRQQAVEVDRAQLELAPVGTLQTGHTGGALLALNWLARREREQVVVHGRNRSCEGPSWESLGGKIHSLLARLRQPRAVADAEMGNSAVSSCATIRRMWQLTLSPLELVLRSVLVYVLFLRALRISGKRELGQFTIFDLALVLPVANALRPAIAGPDASLTPRGSSS